MPFQMTHMTVAKMIVDLNPHLIHNLPDYYLGSLSPDSVHFRDNFVPEHKRISHLCVGEERWGEITNNDEWLHNISSFILSNKRSKSIDFIYGHCVHALTDLCWNIEWWTPFKLKYFNSIRLPNYEDLYHADATDILNVSHTEDFNLDIQLCQQSRFKDEIWEHLADSEGTDLYNIVLANDLNRIRDHILYKQFSNVPSMDSSNNKYITYDELTNFIAKATLFINERLFSNTHIV